MTLPLSGPISLSDVLTELRVANPMRGYPISLADDDVLLLAGKNSLPVNLPSDFYGKSGYVRMVSSMGNVDMYAPSGNTGAVYNQSNDITMNIAGGLAPYVYSWSKISGDGTVDSVNSATSTVRIPVQRFGSPGDFSTMMVQCVVTDARGNTERNQATVTLTLV